MADWRDLLQAVGRTAQDAAVDVERAFDERKRRFKERLGWPGAVMIQPYRGHGSETELRLRGRVLKDKGLRAARDNDTVWQNLLQAYRRFESDEIPGVRVRARLQGVEEIVTTGEEGYFFFDLKPLTPPPSDRLWHEVELELLDDLAVDGTPVVATGEVLVPPIEADFGIISDVDDTVLQTNATSLLNMARVTFLDNARTRLPFEGVAAFYRALHHGPSGTGQNPVFYVSSSPWNLYDLLIDFLDVNGIPAGPLFLRDLGLDEEKIIQTDHETHKVKQIEDILRTHPDLDFVLVGDSGQHDPEIYQRVIDDFPGRVKAIYIRDVSEDLRDAQVQGIVEDLLAKGIEMVLVADSAAAAEHAVAHGLLTPEALPDVRAEKAKDESALSNLEELIG